MTRSHPAVLLLGVCAALVGCRGKDAGAESKPVVERLAPAGEAAADRSGWRVQLDSGNTAFRSKDYRSAEAHYRAATRLDSTSASAWFGVSMAAGALGETAAADSARARAHVLAPAMSLQHPVSTHKPPGPK